MRSSTEIGDGVGVVTEEFGGGGGVKVKIHVGEVVGGSGR